MRLYEYTIMASQKENDLIQYHHGRVMRYMLRNQAPGMDKLSEITKHIYISNWKNGCDLQLLREHGIKGVLCVTNQQKPESVLKGYEKRNINHKQVPFSTPVEGEAPDNLLVHARDMNTFILSHLEKEDRILIHCQDGVSISPAVVTIYMLTRHYMINYIEDMDMTRKLVKPDHMFVPAIIRMLKEYRPCIMIHPAFTWQVLVAEMLLKKQFAAEFRNYLAQERHLARQEKKQDKESRPAKRTKNQTPKKKNAKDGKDGKDEMPNEELSDEDLSNYISQAINDVNRSEFDELSDLKGLRVKESAKTGKKEHATDDPGDPGDPDDNGNSDDPSDPDDPDNNGLGEPGELDDDLDDFFDDLEDE
jgi:hypothetical protein